MFECVYWVDVLVFVVDEVDLIGVGDCFGGMLVVSFVVGLVVDVVLCCVNVVGVIVVMWCGLMEGNSSVVEIDCFLIEWGIVCLV